MKRLLDSDPDELRAEYLCDFAAFYHFPAPVVDALRYLDFIHYILGIDAERQARKEQQAQIDKLSG